MVLSAQEKVNHLELGRKTLMNKMATNSIKKVNRVMAGAWNLSKVQYNLATRS